MDYRLGVDLGTTWTAAAVHDGTQTTMVGLGNRALQIPSIVFVTDDGDFIVGEAADRRSLSAPARAAREFKRRIGDSVPLYIEGRPYSAQLLTSELLQWVVGRVTERMGRPPTEFTITYPANWGPFKRGLLDEICILAGVDAAAVSYCPEPVAAAVHYAARTGFRADGPLLVYDLGGGTFDVCVLDPSGGHFDILGDPAGLEHLGGIDFDEMIFEWVLERISSYVADIDPADPLIIAGLSRLRRECVEAKEALSYDGDAQISVTLPGIDTHIRIVRREFEEMVRPSILRTIDGVRAALAHSRVDGGALTAVVLVGGSSRIPLVAELLSRELDVAVSVDTHPKHDVAMGAALWRRPSVDLATAVPAVPAAPAEDNSAPAVSTPRPGGRADEPLAAVRSAATDPSPPPAAHEEAVAVPAEWNRGRRPKRSARRLAVLGLVVVLAVAGIVVLARGLGSRAEQSAGTASQPGETAGATSAQSEDSVAVPRAAVPLGADSLVWPRVRNNVWGIGIVDLAGKQSKLATDPALDSSFPVISPDRRSVIYVREGGEQWSLRIIATDGSGDRELFRSIPGCVRVQAPAWGPHGMLAIPCQKSSGAGIALQLVTLDGRVVRTLDRGHLGDPTFTRDGQHIVYWRNDVGSRDGGSLYRVSVSGSAPVRLTAGGDGVDNDPVCAPDDKWIAYRTVHDGHFVVAKLPLHLSGPSKPLATPEVLTHGESIEQEPSWSPSGRQIAVIRGTGDERDLVIMNSDGTQASVLVDDDEADAAPAWTAR